MLTVYKASAGSGKTFTLAKWYIKMLLGVKDEQGNYRLNKNIPDRHRAILAITFTNKATDEMKRRIIHELAVIAGKEPGWTRKSPYQDELIETFRCTPQQLKEAAQKALSSLLFDFTFFQVSTIDSFFQTILRTFAHEAEIAGNYEIELTGDDAVNEGVARMFRSLTDEPDARESKRLVQWIKNYLLECFRNGKKVNLMNRRSMAYADLLSLIKKLSDEKLTLRHKEMMEYLSEPRRLERFNIALIRKIEQILRDTAILVNHAVKIIESYQPFPGDKGLKENVRNSLLSFSSSGKFTTTVDTYAAKSDSESRIKLSFYAAYIKSAPVTPQSQLFIAVDDAMNAIAAAKNDIEFYRILASNTFVLGILASVLKRIEDYNKENNTLLLSDTNGLLRKIIGRDETPFMYERLGVRLRNFLIDEFQDTSGLQWQNLRPLLDNALSENNDSLIIGDVKQCIYRFRNSDPGLLAQTVFEDFPGKTVDYNLEEQTVDRNWRSLPDIIRFNNVLFEQIYSRYRGSSPMPNVSQLPAKDDSQYRSLGFVQYFGITKSDDQMADFYKILADDIQRQIDMGYSYSEIAILVRSNKEGAAIIDYLNQLKQHDKRFSDCRIVSEDVVKISDSPAINWIISIMRRAAMTPQDLTDASPKNDVVRLAGRFDALIPKVGNPSQALKLALESTQDNENEADNVNYLTLLSFVEEIVRDRLPADLADSNRAFISAFLDLVAEYMKIGKNDLPSFLKWWETVGNRANLLTPIDSEALTVMTIHKAKGLEFPCVHIPVISWSIADFRNEEWFDLAGLDDICDIEDIPPMIPIRPSDFLLNTQLREQYQKRIEEVTIDEINALYVAFTRPERELSVYNLLGKNKNRMGALLDEALLEINTILPQEKLTSVSLEEKIQRITFGKPTPPLRGSEKKKSVTEPSETILMPQPVSNTRKELWQGLKFRLDEPDEEIYS